MIQSQLIYLTLDLGNTSFSSAAFRNNKLLKVTRLKKGDLPGFKKYFSKWDKAAACIVSSVVKNNSSLLKWLQSQTQVIMLDRSHLLPIKNKYRTPQTLGNDRLACIAGAHALYPGQNILVIDAGTCIKYDFIDVQGVYKGGSISPGLIMRFEALHDYTSNLPLLRSRPTKDFAGSNTAESILTGVQQGIRYEIEGFINEYKRKYKNLKVVMTGGDGARLADHLKSNIFAAPHLIHIGLYEILKKNLA